MCGGVCEIHTKIGPPPPYLGFGLKNSPKMTQKQGKMMIYLIKYLMKMMMR